jgi:hypothetical protein
MKIWLRHLPIIPSNKVKSKPDFARNFHFEMVFSIRTDMVIGVSSNLTWARLACGLALLAQAACVVPLARADDTNPYLTIVDRNAFRLSPPPPPPAPPEAPPPELPTVIFSGTVTIGNETKAIFAIKQNAPKGGPRGAKPEAPAETTFISLKINETGGPVQLLKISPAGDEVELLNSGTKVTMNLKDNGYNKLAPAAPAGPIVPGMRGLPGGPIMPAGQPAAQAQGGGGINLGSSGPAGGPAGGSGGIVTGGSAAYSPTGRGVGLSVGGNGTFTSGNAQANFTSALGNLANAAAGNTLSTSSGGVMTSGPARAMGTTPVGMNATPIPSPLTQLNAGQVNLGSQFTFPNSTAPTPPSQITPPVPTVGRGDRPGQAQ